MDQSPPFNTDLYPRETYLRWYESMYLQRAFEDVTLKLYKNEQKIRGFCHVYNGQEAVSSGIISATHSDDPIITAYRDHGLALARGVSAKSCMAELFGKTTGCAKGKGGSMHFFSSEHHFYGGHGIVGAQIPMGTGLGFAQKYKNTGKVCITLFGDGAIRQGALYESWNMAMLWKIPVVYVCENNGYAMGTSVQRSSNVRELYTIGQAFDMPSFQVNGMRCEDVHEAILEATERAREGQGPTFLEIKTYRYQGHSVSDAGKYRTREELEAYRELDPIETTASTMLQNNLATEDELKAIRKKINEEIAAAVVFSGETTIPKPEEIF